MKIKILENELVTPDNSKPSEVFLRESGNVIIEIEGAIRKISRNGHPVRFEIELLSE